jgi:isocitrate dehydrogenase kinase/phosphatase
VRDTAEAFKQFADNEKLRIRAAQEAKLTNHLHDRTAKLNDLKEFAANFKLKTRIPDDLVPVLAKDHDRTAKLNDLKEFAANFKLKTRIPDDLVPVLAKDEEKQSEIKRKAEESARHDEEKREDHDKDDFFHAIRYTVREAVRRANDPD